MMECCIDKDYRSEIADGLGPCQNICQGEYQQTTRGYPLVSKPLDVFVIIHFADNAKTEEGRVLCKIRKTQYRGYAIM